MAPRSLPEWIDRSPDTRVPAHVRLRILPPHVITIAATLWATLFALILGWRLW